MPKVRSLKTIRPIAWVPPEYNALYKIEITRRNADTTDDITEKIYEGEVIDGATDTIGSFEFIVDNSSQEYRGAWIGNEIIKIYIDYATTATTLRFRGRIEQVSYIGHRIKIKGRSEAKRLLDVTVSQAYSSQETSVIIKDLFDKYATDFTYTNVGVSTSTVTVNWYQKPMWECIQELCGSSGFDFYIDSAMDAHYFEKRTINNTTDAIVHTYNLLEVGDFAYDQSLIKNKVTVYGSDIGDLALFKTAQDDDSISEYGLKEEIIEDFNITTETQAQERADYELSLSKDPPLTGDVTSVGLATIQPGENIMISDPPSNLNPVYYRAMKYRHQFRGFMRTTITIEKEPKNVYHVLKDRITQEQKISDTPNPNEMQYSWNFDFETDSGTHDNTEITEGVLKTTTGQATGTWISDNEVLTSLPDSFELRATGGSLVGTNYWVSVDGGATWQSVAALKTLYTFNPPGLTLKIKVELNSEETQIEGLALYYK